MQNHQFIVHHDLYISDDGTKPFRSQIGFPGHAYVELTDLKKTSTNNTIGIWGFFPEGCSRDSERLQLAKTYQNQHPNDKILFSKAFLIDKAATDRIEAYASKCIFKPAELPVGDPEASYNFFINNCVDFVNRLFKLTGLPGLYSWHLTSEEIEQIPGIIRPHVIVKMGPGDNPQIVKGSSIEDVAAKYNIDPSLVTKKGLTQNIPIMEVSMLQEAADILSYVIAPNPLLAFADADREAKYPAIEEITESAKAELEKNKEGATVSLDGNAAINELLSDPTKLAAYQQQSMSLAMQGIEEADQLIPGLGSRLLSAASTSQDQYGDLLSSIFPSESEMQNANKDAAAIANDAQEILSSALASVNLPGHTSFSEIAADETQEKPSAEAATADFVNSILAASTISNSNREEAEQFVQGIMPSTEDMFANPDMQDFLSAFSVPDMSNMMGQNFNPDETDEI